MRALRFAAWLITSWLCDATLLNTLSKPSAQCSNVRVHDDFCLDVQCAAAFTEVLGTWGGDTLTGMSAFPGYIWKVAETKKVTEANIELTLCTANGCHHRLNQLVPVFVDKANVTLR